MVVSVMTIFTVFPFLFHRNVDKIKKNGMRIWKDKKKNKKQMQNKKLQKKRKKSLDDIVDI